MGKIQDCADKIYNTMVYSDSDNYITTESHLRGIMETMLIFLDYDDMIYIFRDIVIPMYTKRKHKNSERWLEFLNGQIEYLQEFTD